MSDLCPDLLDHLNIFAPGGVGVWLKVLLSLFRLVLGTGRSFKFPPDRKYLRWQP
jgi:hypothetical protein